MNFSSFKTIYPKIKEKIGDYHIHFTADLWWKIIIISFMAINIFSATFGYITFRNVSSNSNKSELIAPATSGVFNKAELSNLLKFYRAKNSNLEKLQNSTIVRKDPSF